MSDEELLLDEATPRWRRRSAFLCLAIFAFGCIALVSAIVASYFLIQNQNVIGLKVMSLNTWGMPASLGSVYKEDRMIAIGEHISKAEFDVYLLEELWMRGDHATIKAHLPEGYYMTEVGDLSSSCDGVVGPEGCSGLAVISKYPFVEVKFHGYSYHGDALWLDGEWLARKGVGKVRIEPVKNHTVDVFVTHTCASDYNSYYRERQAKELVQWVGESDADFVVLGGDFNADPVVNANETTIQDVKNLMVNSIEEYFQVIKAWLVPGKATYGNPKNSYSNESTPVLYDYIFHKPKEKNLMWTNFFQVPILKSLVRGISSEIESSFSDHEAVTAHLYMIKVTENENLTNKINNN